MKIITVALMCLVVAELAYSQEPKKSEAASLQGHDEIISQLRTAYAACNRGDLDAAVALLVPKIEWTLLISASQSATIPRGEVSRDNSGRAEHEYDCKNRPTGPDQSYKKNFPSAPSLFLSSATASLMASPDQGINRIRARIRAGQTKCESVEAIENIESEFGGASRERTIKGY